MVLGALSLELGVLEVDGVLGLELLEPKLPVPDVPLLKLVLLL